MKKILSTLVITTIFLSACTAPRETLYSVVGEVALTQDEVSAFEMLRTDLAQQITSYEPPSEAVPPPVVQIGGEEDGSLTTRPADDTDDAETPAIDTRPPFTLFIEKARTEASLGLLGAALQTYDEGLELYPDMYVGLHNRARLLERMQRYDLAIRDYQRIIDTANDFAYYQKIAWAHYYDGKYRPAQQALANYEEKMDTRDTLLEEYLEKAAR